MSIGSERESTGGGRRDLLRVGGTQMQRWSPRVVLSAQEKMLMKRLTRVRTLFGFLRQHRHELFDDAFQEQLQGMYRITGAGEEPHPPAVDRQRHGRGAARRDSRPGSVGRDDRGRRSI